jgi:hypothetical protein
VRQPEAASPQAVLECNVDEVEPGVDVGGGREGEAHANQGAGLRLQEDRADDRRDAGVLRSDLDLPDPNRFGDAGQPQGERVRQAIVVERVRSHSDRVRYVVHVVAVRDHDRLAVIVLDDGQSIEVVVEAGDRKLPLLAQAHDSLPDLVRSPPVDLDGDLVGPDEALAVDLRRVEEEVDEPATLSRVGLESGIHHFDRAALDSAPHELECVGRVPRGVRPQLSVKRDRWRERDAREESENRERRAEDRKVQETSAR